MKLEDFNNIDINNAGSLPAAVKAVLLAAIFFVILALGYYFLWTDAFTSLDTAKAKEQELRQVFLDKQAQAVNLVGYKQQMVEIEKTFGALLKQLPDKSQMDGLLTDINQAGLNRGLEFELFKPGQETQAEFYAEMPISIKVLGTYHDLGAFATDISKLSRIVTLNDISVTTGGKDAKASDAILVMEATARTYRYLDANEIASKKSASKVNPGGKG
ncbi:MAG: type 4a pilus biogenesis protein PilO [Methylotenera sp.]|uniref:type 4a pilus biogenesis protein PilO n=1 Tax=Methylotenera sp. TaxID=2051956 RepID=UPI00271C9C32|nr:type 4a pilus biogenesis protein PilO [Methylotenera sp.]MDO9393735.1 type 4a pilus biogenesis protein PilO [Methylotenera sp.]MDP1523449.1 type 4a pilus biogenesis protein PilO [Methylotenera sp.]MDP3817662.1 type 4a pilus biogenesis protein PilO [Methylotenera sp.]